ncbi:cytochrome P450 [Streptomyces sp. NPDC048389]|uniref:cytochrome P450 family protein n=1 Tax=Streptomyces sp. NPDC048389 TaxID=3154622 RepID=UPI003456E854
MSVPGDAEPTRTVDLTAEGSAFTADPYPRYAELRALGPVHRVRTHQSAEVWLIVGHEEARAALVDPRLSKDRSNAPDWRGEEPPAQVHMLHLDPPEHTRLRKLVISEFTPRRVESLAPRVQQITDELLDAMLARPGGSGDLVERLAFPLPMTVICELLGVPDLEREAFRGWSNQMVARASPAAASAAGKAMKGYLAELIECKGRLPGDDLLSALIRATGEGGDRLSRDEVVGMAILLLVAGHETTVNLITNAVLALLRHPDQMEWLRTDLSLVEHAVEETLRYDAPVESSTFRFTAEPVEVGGTVIPAGEVVLVSLASAGRDPGRFPDADRFDIRRDARGHIAFGHGVHYCLGAPLARLEARIALRTLLERCPVLALDTADPAELPRIPGMLMRGVHRLPIRWAPL